MSERLGNTASEVPPTNAGSAASTGLPRIALLYSDEALLAHVEHTLAALRVPVVHRAGIEQVDHVALKGTRPEIALINLDDRCGEKLDAVTAALDAAGIPIVFNDADISNGLEGWARARWARHLCAKLCGKDDVDPPRPARAAGAPSVVATPAVVAEMPPAAAAVAESPAMTAETADREAPAPAALATSPAMDAERAHLELPAEESGSASRPLSQGEIDALVADFPSEAEVSGADTEEWSAQIDALLASAPDSASSEPAPWEVLEFEDENSEQPAVAATPVKSQAPAAAQAKAPVAAASSAPLKSQAATAAAAPARPVATPSVDQWQLVDDSAPAVTAPREKPAPAPVANFGSGLALELEPLDSKEGGE